MSITDLLRNTNEEAVAATYSNSQDSLTTGDDSESMYDASTSERSFIPPSSESLNATVPQSESLTVKAVPSSLENDPELHIPSQASPAIRAACHQIMNAPGPRSKKRRRVLELLNDLQPGDIAHSQQMLDYLESQNEDPTDMRRFMKKMTKKLKPPTKRRRVRTEADSSTSSRSDVGPVELSLSSIGDSSSQPRLVIDLQSQSLQGQPSQQSSSSGNAAGPSRVQPGPLSARPGPASAKPGPSKAVAKPAQVVVPPRPAPQPQAAPAAIPDLPSQSSTSSSSDSSPAMRPPQRPDANPHSNMAAPRRVNYNFPVPNSSTNRDNRPVHAKTLGG